MKMAPHKALFICLSTLLASSIFVLQNADYYATRCQESAIPYAPELSAWLMTAAEYSGLAELNTAQRNWLDKWLALATGEQPPSQEPAPESEPPVVDADPIHTPDPLPQEPIKPAEKEPIVDSESTAERTPDSPSNQSPITYPQPLTEDALNPLDFAHPLPFPTPAPEPPPAPIIKDIIEDVQGPTPAPVGESVSLPENTEEPPASTDEPQQIQDEPSSPSEPPAPVQPTPAVRCKIMMLGDSMMEDLGPRTHRFLRNRKGLKFILSAKFSTGLCRPDFFDWPAHMREAVAEHKPDIVIVFIGANDGQPIKHHDAFTPTGGQAWRDTYGEKMKEIVDIAHANGAKVIWVGLPSIGGRYAKLLAETSKTQIEKCQEMGISYIDTRPTLSDNDGNFQTFCKGSDGKIIRLRRPDKTHLTPEGNKLIIDQLLPLLEKHLQEFSAAHPELCLTPEETHKMGPAPLAVTIKYKPINRKRKKK